MMKELTPHLRVVPPAHIDHSHLESMLNDHMSRLEHMIKKMQRDIPVYVDERLYMQNATTLTLLPQSQNLELITGLLAVVTASGGATLTLGDRTIPLAQGNTFFNLAGNGFLLNNGSTRQIVQTVAGELGLELFGIELPDKGVLR